MIEVAVCVCAVRPRAMPGSIMREGRLPGWVSVLALPFPAHDPKPARSLPPTSQTVVRTGVHRVRDFRLHGAGVPLDVGSRS